MPDGTRLSLERTGRAELAIALWTMDAMLGVRAWALYMYHRSYQRETVAIRIAKGSASDFLVNTSRTAVYGTAVTTRSAKPNLPNSYAATLAFRFPPVSLLIVFAQFPSTSTTLRSSEPVAAVRFMCRDRSLEPRRFFR